MDRDDYIAKARELSDFAHDRGQSYPDFSEERGIWMRIYQHLENVIQELDG